MKLPDTKRVSAFCLLMLAAPLLIWLLPLQASPQNAQQAQSSQLFLPLTAGTSWVYSGTGTFSEQEAEKPVTTNVSITMKVERVYQKPEFTLAVISGYPGDLDWSNGQVEPKPSLLIETVNHEVFLDPLPPDFDYAKLDKDAASLEKLISEDNLLFRWPLKKGLKFGDAESVGRDDSNYCWVVLEQHTRNLSSVKGISSHAAEVFLLRYATNPDDTKMELSHGVGILSYEYHHHGTVADTSLKLVEFHPGPVASTANGAN